VTKSVLDQDLILAELLDVEGFREVCRTFSELYGIGIKVFDSEGHKIVDVRASTGDHCGYLFTVHRTQVMCTNLVNKVKTVEVTQDSGSQQIECFSGLKYDIVPLVYEGTLLGRFIFGPYAPDGLDAPPRTLEQYEPELDVGRLAGYLAAIPRAANETVQKVIEHITRVLGVIMHTSYRTQLTSKLHIASISGAFDDLERSNRDLKAANRKLSDLDRLKSNFIATVSHELRTPLTSVRGYLEALADGVVPPERSTFDMLQSEVQRLVKLSDDLLELARADAARAYLRLEPVDLKALTRQALRLHEARFRDKGIAVHTRFAEQARSATADPDKLLQALGNLVENAWRYTPDGGRLDIQAEAVADGVRLSFTNDAERIEESDLRLLFERFYRPDKSRSRQQGGAGIGLSVVKELLEAHGGRVHASQTNGRLSIHLTLPR
jgi:signal transduction histidine kinase